MERPRRVREEDGRTVPFSETRLAESILAAARTTGTPDRTLARELAGVISLFLARRFRDDSPPTAAEIRDVVKEVLRETGHGTLSRAYAEDQDRKEAARRTLLVLPRRDGEEGDPAESATLTGLPWRRTAIVESLRAGAELPEPVAEEIASAVERRIFATGLTRITTALIREFVSNELIERSVPAASAGAARLGLRRREIGAVLAGEAADERGLQDLLAERIVAPAALDLLHGAEVRRLHREGLLHADGLERPLSVDRLEVPFDTVGADDPGTAVRNLFLFLAEAQAWVRGSVRIRDLSARLLADLSGRGAGGRRAEIDRLLPRIAAPDAHGRSLFPRLEIPVPLDGEGDLDPAGARALASELLSALERHPDAGQRVAVVLAVGRRTAGDPGARGLLKGALRLAARGAPVTFELARGSETLAERRALVTFAAVALNLPGVLAGPSGGDAGLAFDALGQAVDRALLALGERYWHFRSRRPVRADRLAERAGIPAQAFLDGESFEGRLEIWGLPVASSRLAAAPGDATAVVRAAARILGLIQYRLAEQAEDLPFRVRISAPASRTVRSRFVRSAALRAAGDETLRRLLRTDPRDPCSVPVVTPVTAPANQPLLAAGFSELLGPGLLWPVLPDLGAPPISLFGALIGGSRLRAISLAGTGSGALIEVQEDLFEAEA